MEFGADRAFCSWSGGKDSCLALHVASEAGLDVRALLTVFEPDADRSRSHAVSLDLIARQARALGIPLIAPRADWPDYEREFIAALRDLRGRGFTHGVFGDIDLDPHREWEERVCGQAGVAADLPLWRWPRDHVVEEVFARGLRAVCVCVNTRMLGAEFCGRVYDRSFIADLPPGVDACGENGEFHTFVTDAPMFDAPLDVAVAGYRDYVAPAELGGDAFRFAVLRGA